MHLKGLYYARYTLPVFTGRVSWHGVNTGVIFGHPWTRTIEIGRRYC